MMDKDEVIKRFCELATLVGKYRYKHQQAHDCFCSDAYGKPDITGFAFDEAVMFYIEKAVVERLSKEMREAISNV